MAGRTETLIAKEQLYGASNYKPLPLVIERAEGAFVWDVEGKRYLDCLSSYSALSQGHRHPKIMEAMKKQMDKVTLTSRAFYNEELPRFCEELAQVCGMEMVLPMNTGAEAVETAIKAARKWGYKVKGVQADKAEIVVCEGNFHGRTTTIVGFSSEESYKDGFGPFTPGFKIIPYGDIDALKQAITPNTVMFMVEPIQGEAGVVVPPEGYIKQARDLCHDQGVLFAADEIQTGLGRTGRMFCCDWDEVTPDMYILGKALGGGVYPVSAVVSSKDVLGVFLPGQHGSTFGGNPLAAAVARESLKVLAEEGMVERSDRMGEALIKRLKSLNHSLIKEVRGKGLFVGIELHAKAGGARKYCERLMERGVLCKETHEDVIRIAPPLMIEQADLDWAIDQLVHIFNSAETGTTEEAVAQP